MILPLSRLFFTRISHVLRRHDWHKLLADRRGMVPSRDGERIWIREFRLASSPSYALELCGAVGIPSDVLARRSVSLVMNDSQQPALPS